MAERSSIQNWLLGLVGAALGGAVGHFLFFVIVRQGFYAMVLPGALMGLGCGALSGFKSTTLGIVCGVMALLLGLFIEWQFAPFVVDDSLPYFLAHVHQLKTMSLAMIVLGGLFGYWFGRGQERGGVRHGAGG